MSHLFAHRDVRLYLAGQGASLLGDTSLWLAVGIWVKSLTGSSSAAGMVWFALIAGQLTAPLSGVLVDRLRRRPLLIAANLATGAGVLALLAVHGRDSVWLIYLVMFGYGASSSLISAGQSALLAAILPETLLASANGTLQTVREGLRIVAPLAGAGLFALVGPHPVIIGDAGTFAVATLALAAMRTSERRGTRPPSKTSGWAEISAGARHIGHTPALRHMIAAVVLAVAGIGLIESVMFSVNSDGLHRAAPFMGVLMMVQGAGALAGGPTAAPAIRRLGEDRVATLGLMACAVGPLLMMPSSLPVVLAGCALFGAGLPWTIVAYVTLVQRLTPAGLQGRTSAAADLMISTPQTISIVTGAGLLAVLNYRILLAAIVVIVAAAGYLLTRPEQRRDDRATEQPELNPDEAPESQYRNDPGSDRYPKHDANR